MSSKKNPSRRSFFSRFSMRRTPKKFTNLSDIQSLSPEQIIHIDPTEISKKILTSNDAYINLEQRDALKLLINQIKPNVDNPKLVDEYKNRFLIQLQEAKKRLEKEKQDTIRLLSESSIPVPDRGVLDQLKEAEQNRFLKQFRDDKLPISERAQANSIVKEAKRKADFERRLDKFVLESKLPDAPRSKNGLNFPKVPTHSVRTSKTKGGLRKTNKRRSKLPLV